MNLLLCLIAIWLSSKFVKSEDLKDLDINQLIQLADDVSQIKTGDIKNEDVTFFLCTRESSGHPIKISTKSKSDLNITKHVKIIIHGWIANNRRSWYKSMTEEFLKNGDFNIIQVNWEGPARTSYLSSSANTKLIGRQIAQFITNMSFPIKNVHLIGHSLGAHIAGFAAKDLQAMTGQKVARISGLDPAGPHFREYFLNTKQRLDKGDAKIVDVIHTDAGMYGIDYPIGTLDIYVNGGRGPQPGCLFNLDITSLGSLLENSYCSHARSCSYFIEWLNKGKFYCRLCSSWIDFLENRCNKTIAVGENDVDSTITGICFSGTHVHEPFLLN